MILWMAAEGVNVLTHDERTGFGVLHAAARGGQPALLQQLLAWDIEVLDNDGAAPLHSSSHCTLDGGAVYKCADLTQTALSVPAPAAGRHADVGQAAACTYLCSCATYPYSTWCGHQTIIPTVIPSYGYNLDDAAFPEVCMMLISCIGGGHCHPDPDVHNPWRSARSLPRLLSRAAQERDRPQLCPQMHHTPLASTRDPHPCCSSDALPWRLVASVPFSWDAPGPPLAELAIVASVLRDPGYPAIVHNPETSTAANRGALVWAIR